MSKFVHRATIVGLREIVAPGGDGRTEHELARVLAENLDQLLMSLSTVRQRSVDGAGDRIPRRAVAD